MLLIFASYVAARNLELPESKRF